MATSGTSSTSEARNRKIYIMRHGERSDFLAGDYGESYMTTAFDENGNYTPFDVNQPSTVPEREGGWKAFRHDAPLTEVGKFEAMLMGKAYKEKKIKIDVVYSSPSLRCVQTAAHFIKGYGEDLKIATEPGLFEFSGWYEEDEFPRWMKTHELIREGHPLDEDYIPFVSRDVKYHLESVEQYYERTEKIMKEILEKHPNENLFFCGHGSSLEANSRALCGGNPRPKQHFFYVIVGLPYLANIELTEGENGLFAITGRPIPSFTVEKKTNYKGEKLTKTEEEIEEELKKKPLQVHRAFASQK